MTKDQEPKVEEMKQMSEYVSKLEGYADLEVAIIRVTKINKVLKAILKLPTIPKEEEFQFKPRSQSLLDKWNKLLATDVPQPSTPPTNGATEESKAEADEQKPTSVEPMNGVEESKAETDEEKPSADVDTPMEEAKEEVQEDGKEATNEESTASPTEDAPKVCYSLCLLTRITANYMQKESTVDSAAAVEATS